MSNNRCKILLITLLLTLVSIFSAFTHTRGSLFNNSLSAPLTQMITSNSDEHYIQSIENETLLVHTMELNVRNDNSLKIVSSFVLTNNDSIPISHFYFQIKKNISSLFCYDPLGSLPFSWKVDSTLGNEVNITMNYPLLQDDTYVFSISYEIEDVIYHVEKPEEYFGLDFETTHIRKTDQFNLILNLPMNSYLLEETLPAPVYPTPSFINSDGNFLIITWEETNLNIDDSDVFLVRYRIQSTDLNSPPNLLALYIVLAFLGGVAVSALGAFLIYRFKFKPVETGLVSSLLSDTEQEVIKAINEDSGISTQRRICEKTGYSKSKVSQILAKLEEKEVLKRERWGRTNKVTITNPSFKVLGQDTKQHEKISS